MWFKNVAVYDIKEQFNLTAEELEKKLEPAAYHPCGKLDLQSQGWVPPAGRHSEQLVHAANGYLMICLQTETKLIPGEVVKDALEERIEALEEREARKVRKTEKDRLKDEVIIDLLPQAFSRRKQLFAYIDTKQQRLVIDASSWAKAEDLSEALRDALGSLSIAPPDMDMAPEAVLTDWVHKDRAPEDFILGDACILRDPQVEGSEIRCKRQDLEASEVKSCISAGKRVKRVAIEWNERLSFEADADMLVRKVKFQDIVQEGEGDSDDATAMERFDSDFAIMTLELDKFITRFMEVLTGEEADAEAA